MNRKLFRLSVVSSAILATTQVSAALYNVVEVTPSTTYNYKSAYGVAIEPAITTAASDNCFESNTAGSKSCESFILAGETRSTVMNAGEAVDGLSFREEAPFGMNRQFSYIQNYDDFENYCDAQLGYSTCEYWADARWNVWSAEMDGNTTPISIGFIGSSTTSDDVYDSANVVINSISDNGAAIGIQSQPGNVTKYRRNNLKALVEDGAYSPNDDYLQTRAWKTDGTYTVGSVSESYETSDYGTYYVSHPAIWDNSTGAAVEIPWHSGTAKASSNYLAQGSIRDFVVVDDMIYGVGFNAYDSSYNYMNATVFSVNVANYGTASSWTSKVVNGATVKIDGDTIHTNSVITSVNKNKVAIGSAKRTGSTPYNGAASNRLFLVKDVSASSLTAVFPSVGILFAGAGGKAGAINDYNEIVGQVDFDDTREIDGKPRVKRGFIYPYSATNSDTTRMARFANQPWYLDDLTNDDDVDSTNNQYRVVDATDINNAGVISGTAFKCAGGYSTTAHNSTCSGTETVVAVKLVPIAGATSANISQRSTETSSSNRSGASLGLWGLILLGLGWFRRK
ncbi:MAG: DUF3466 family protein [Vibrio sp.]|uniref:DUF3466 family protein n=1 Tax=Vibrio sp. TaxID=678 RepID=UPI003A83F102